MKMRTVKDYEPIDFPTIRTTVGCVRARFKDPEIAAKLQEVLQSEEVKSKISDLEDVAGEVAEYLENSKEELVTRCAVNENIMLNMMNSAIADMIEDAEKWDMKAALLDNINVKQVCEIISGLIETIAKMALRSSLADLVMKTCTDILSAKDDEDESGEN